MQPEIRIKGALNRFADSVSEALSEDGPISDPDGYWFAQAMERAEAAMTEFRRRVGRSAIEGR